MTVYILAVERCTGWSFAHVREKVFEAFWIVTIPPCADVNPATAVAVEVSAFRVIAAKVRVNPCFVFGAL